MAVVERAARELGDAEVPDREPDHDWTARFFNYIQDVSSEEMQSLWAKVLAGEVERPKSTSIRTLGILRNLDREAAVLFGRLCSACVSLTLDGEDFIDARVPSLGGNVGNNALQKYGLGFGELSLLEEYGLIISDYNSWRDYRMCRGIRSPEPAPGWVRIPFGFQGQYWVLLPTIEPPVDKEFRLSGVALTRSGRELSRIVNLEPMDEYAQALKKFFKGSNLQMTEVDGSQPRFSTSWTSE